MLLPKRVNFFVSALFLLLTLGGLAHGQSLDINSPAPVTTNELTGKILARDIGDARFTDHFYAFVGNQGDLIVTIESKNLNGDVDVFSAAGLRPLMKFSLYAESSAPVSKAIFLRKREDLVLRVQARSPNDDEGNYLIRFSGSFEALPAPAVAENATPAEESPAVSQTGDKNVRRVTSSGARIYEPEPAPSEVASATPEPTPEATPEPTLAETPTRTEKAETSKPTPPPRTPRRRGRRPTPTRPVTETVRKTEETQPTTEQPSTETPSSTSRRGSSRPTTPKTESPVSTQEEDVGPRLIIETQDGTLINRSMITVRRVMVENGQVIVVGKDGGVQRVRLADVIRMTIATQQ